MLCTGEYRSVNEPTLSTSTRFWLAEVVQVAQRAVGEPHARCVVAVKSDRFTAVRARVATAPLT